MKNLKGVMVAVLFMLLVSGCAGWQLSDSGTHQLLGYGAGRGFCAAIYELANDPKDLDAEISAAWVAMMDKNHGAEIVPSEDIMIFYNQLLQITSRYYSDPWGIVGDFGFLLVAFGAELNPETNEMTFIQPVPRKVMMAVQMGFENSRIVMQGKM